MSKMGSQKKEAILQAKWAVNLLKKAKWERMSSLPAKLLESSKAIGFRLVLLVQPSSAVAERVFSILQQFIAQQQSSLEDYLELSVMLQYNFNCKKGVAKWVED